MNRKIYAFCTVLLYAQGIITNDEYAGLPAYQQILSEQVGLSNQVKLMCDLFDQSSLLSSGGAFYPSSIAPGKPVTTVQIPVSTTTVFYDASNNQNTYAQVFDRMKGILGVKGASGVSIPYNVLFDQVQSFYQQLGDSASVLAPFASQSIGLQVYRGLAGSVITYLQKRLATITSKTYAQANAAQELQTEIATFDKIIGDIADQFNQNLDSANKSLLKKHLNTAGSDLVDNYQTIQQNYHQRKAQLLLACFDPLVHDLATLYATGLAKNRLTTDLDIQSLDVYVQLLFSSLSVFSSTQTTTLLGKYSSVPDVIASFSAQMATLFLFQAQVFQNAVEHNIQIWGQPGMVLSEQNFNIITGQIQSCGSLFSSAASYYAAAQQLTVAPVYAQQSAALQSGLQSWQSAVTMQQQGYMGQIAQLFDQASTQFKNAGNTYLSFYLYQQFQQALLAYDESIITTYGNYYQSVVSQYINQAQKVPTGQSLQDMAQYHKTFQSLFYPLTPQDAQNAAYKGMGWLAQIALPSFKDILSTLQTLTGTAQAKQQQFLQQGIALLQNISDGSQYIFYTSPDASGATQLPADQNSSSYTVKGMVQALEQYSTIIQLFSQADALIEEAEHNNMVLPFAQVLPQSAPISSWKQLILLHQAYWFLVCAEQARAYATTCSVTSAQAEELVSSALIAFMNAQAVYTSLAMPDMVTYIQTQIQSMVGSANAPVKYASKTVEALLLQKASSYTASASPAFLDIQAALTCYQVGGLLGFVSCQNKFFSTLDDYQQIVLKQTTNPVQNFTLSAIAVQGIYAQKAGWQTTNKYADDFSKYVALFGAQVAQLTPPSSQLSLPDQIAAQKQFVGFYKQYQAFVIEQERLALLYGLSLEPYLDSEMQGMLQVNLTSSTLKKPIASFTEPSYELARLLVASAQAQLNTLQNALYTNTFTGSLSDPISAIETAYNQAIEYYSAAGLQDEVLATEQLKTKAVALLYYGLVVPSESILLLAKKFSRSSSGQSLYQSTKASTSADIWTVGETGVSSSQPAGSRVTSVAQKGSSTGIQKPFSVEPTLPAYVLRSVDVDITALAQSFIKNASLSQTVTKSSSLQVAGTTSPDMSQDIAAAQQLIQVASTLVGKSATSANQDMVTKVVVPLYRLQLQQEGYTGFFTLDQQVQKYQGQLELLMNQGMAVGSITLKTAYTITQQKNADGTNHLILQGTNVPLSGVAQFQGQTQSALFYYTLCSNFYDTNQPTTSVGDAVYMTVSAPELQTKVSDAMRLTYIAGALSYIQEIKEYIANLQTPTGIPLSQATLAQKASLKFSDYQTAYTTMNSMFIWALSLIDNISSLQGDQTSYLDVTTAKISIYNHWAQACSYFLMGDPSSGSFQSVLKDVANNYYTVTQMVPAASAIQPSLALSTLYEQVADYTRTLALPLTQTNGYPSALPTPFSTSSGTVSKTLSYDPPSLGTLTTLNKVFAKTTDSSACPALPVAELYPSTQPLSWYNYQQAAAFYQQAYTTYQQALLANNKKFMNNMLLTDQNLVRMYGKFFYYDFFSSMQALSLFARNAYVAGLNTNINTIVGATAPDFLTIVKQGGSAGTSQATAGFGSLTSGASDTASTDAGQQYNTMRTLMLNAILYLTGVQGTLNQLITNLGLNNAYSNKSGTLNTLLNARYGRLLQCAFTIYIPGLQTLIGGKNIDAADTLTPKVTGSIDTLKPIFEIPSYLLDLQNSFSIIFQTRIFHATTFLTAMQYIVENTLGTPANNFALLGDADNQYLNLLVFNKLVSELWSIMRDLYGQAFLADLYASHNVQAYENAIDAAIQGQEQQLIINPASYIG